MNHQHAEFRNRLRQLDRKHAKAAHGFRARMRSDGLIVVEPQKVVRSGISGKVFILFVVVGLMFKAFLMAALGYASYDYRVAQLGEGSVIERRRCVPDAARPGFLSDRRRIATIAALTASQGHFTLIETETPRPGYPERGVFIWTCQTLDLPNMADDLMLSVRPAASLN